MQTDIHIFGKSGLFCPPYDNKKIFLTNSFDQPLFIRQTSPTPPRHAQSRTRSGLADDPTAWWVTA